MCFRLLPNTTLRASVMTYSPVSEESCFDGELQSVAIPFHVGVGGKSKRCQKQNPPLGSTLLPKMTTGSTPVIVDSEAYSGATCPWNPDPSFSFVFSIHDQLLCHLLIKQGIVNMKDMNTFPFIKMTSSCWLYLRTCLIKIKSCILRGKKNPMLPCYYWEANSKALLMHEGLASQQVVWGFGTDNEFRKKKWCLKLKHINLEQCYSHFIEAILCVTIPHISNKPPSVAFIKGSWIEMKWARQKKRLEFTSRCQMIY